MGQIGAVIQKKAALRASMCLVLTLSVAPLASPRSPRLKSHEDMARAAVSGFVQRREAGRARPVRPTLKSWRDGLTFEPNVGQTGPQAKFVAHGGGYGLFLTGSEVVLSLRSQRPGVRNQFERRPWPVVRGSSQKTNDDRLRIGLIGSTSPSLFSTQNSQPSAPSVSSSFVRLQLIGANPNPKVMGMGKLKGRSNYFIGNDPKKWRTNVPNYARVLEKDVYRGIDQVFYGKDGQLEYDFVVHPGADPKQIRLVAETGNWQLAAGNWKLQTGNGQLATAANGDLVLGTEAGEVRFGKPVVYQATTDRLDSELITHNSGPVEGNYVLSANNELRFEVGSYNQKETLVIDPTLNYLATFGGSAETQGQGITVDSAQNAYVVGFTQSADLPTTPSAFQASCTPNATGFCNEAVVRKIGPSGAVVYSTYIGGSVLDQGFAIAVDSSGDAYVTGTTESPDFPVLNAFQPTLEGADDAFVTELNPTGSALVYSSFLGGASGTAALGDQEGAGIAVDGTGNAYVTGLTGSPDFPTTPNAFQTVFAGNTNCGGATTPRPCPNAFVTKVAPSGSSLVYSTYLGGSGGEGDIALGIALDPAGNAYVTGLTHSFDFPVLNAFQRACGPQTDVNGVPVCNDAFVTEVNPSGSGLVFSTFLGGSGSDEGLGIALDPGGNVYVTGDTGSADFPLSNALQSSPEGVFVTEFNAGATRLVYSTYFGGSVNDLSGAIAVDSLGEAYVTGYTPSTAFPLVNAVQQTYGGGSFDAFVAGLQTGGAGLIYSTYLGGDGQDLGFGIAVDAAGDAWVTGASNSTTFVAAISRPEVVHRDVPASGGPSRNALASVGQDPVLPRAAGGRPHLLRPEQGSSSGVTQALAGSIALDMARVHAAPASLAFEAQVAGTTSAPETVTISNPGTAPLTFSAIAASDSFTVPSGGSCSTSSPVAPGGSCTVDVAFAPTVGGTLTGTLTLTDNGIGSPHTLPLSGTGQDFTLSANSNSASVAAGGTATFNLSVASQGGFNHSLDLSCTDPASLSTCTVSPASVTPTSANPATVTVSVTTTASSQVAPRGPNGPGPIAGQRPALQLYLVALAMLALLAVAAASRRRVAQSLRGSNSAALVSGVTEKPQSFWRTKLCATCLALALLLLLVWAACGGGGQPGTPAGTYTVTLKALDTQANLSHSTTVTLTVH